MPGLLVASELGKIPAAFGSCDMKAQPGLDSAFDLDSFHPTPYAAPLVVVVSPEDRNTLAVMQLAEGPASGAFLPPEQWKAIGVLNSTVVRFQL